MTLFNKLRNPLDWIVSKENIRETRIIKSWTRKPMNFSTWIFWSKLCTNSLKPILSKALLNWIFFKNERKIVLIHIDKRKPTKKTLRALISGDWVKLRLLIMFWQKSFMFYLTCKSISCFQFLLIIFWCFVDGSTKW